jgi:hypothetical protein
MLRSSGMFFLFIFLNTNLKHTVGFKLEPMVQTILVAAWKDYHGPGNVTERRETVWGEMFLVPVKIMKHTIGFLRIWAEVFRKSEFSKDKILNFLKINGFCQFSFNLLTTRKQFCDLANNWLYTPLIVRRPFDIWRLFLSCSVPFLHIMCI